MKYKLIAVALAVAALAGCSGSGDQTKRDLEGIKMQEPDTYEVFIAPDKFPNIGRTCIDGVAFATTTRIRQQLVRVEEWDSKCPGYVKPVN